MLEHQKLLDRMQILIAGWEQARDQRAIFLSCYVQMTANMFKAIDRGEFHDPAWVANLVHHFAEYYFEALEAYNSGLKPTPGPWLATFDAAQNPRLHVLQHLVLGINAHINYDLCFAIEDSLRPEWYSLDTPMREQRYEDHCHVNLVIASTLDAVQDTVVERYSPAMNLVDRLLGRLDEELMSQMIQSWRGEVWKQALLLVEGDAFERQRVSLEIETRATNRAKVLLGPKLVWFLEDTFN
ncbi:MAG: DUF5995 family protein [Anaerolineales bacterium]|jgi:hypothetical protein|nr:DUF5995 family protein [Anaerolineales bacterium]